MGIFKGREKNSLPPVQTVPSVWGKGTSVRRAGTVFPALARPRRGCTLRCARPYRSSTRPSARWCDWWAAFRPLPAGGRAEDALPAFWTR